MTERETQTQEDNDQNLSPTLTDKDSTEYSLVT